MGSVDARGRLWRSRWAAIGAAVAVTFGAGGLVAVNAAGGVDSTTVLTDPVRVLDSRDPVDVGLVGPFVSQVSQKLQVTGSIATTTGTKTVVPGGATGVLLNVTAVAPTADGFVSIRPGDATGLPSTSSLNVSAGEVVPNAVLVALPVGGANDGEIDITFDAYGVAGRSTDLLIDVVGYTNNSADVYTKSEIDASAPSSVKAAGEVGGLGTQFCSTYACVGTWSVARTGTGSYFVTVPAATPSLCRQPLAQVTPLAASARIATVSFANLSCVSGDWTFNVRTFDVAGALVDTSFYSSVQVEPDALTTPALTDSTDHETGVDGDGEVACE